MLRQLVQQAASVAGLRIVGTALSVGVSVAIARFFGADALGIYAYCVALMAIAAVPISNGWSTMLLRTVSRSGEVGGTPKAMAKMGAVGAIFATILAALLAFAAIRLANSEVALALKPITIVAVGLIGIALLCDQLSAMRMASIRGINRPVLAQLPESLLRPSILLIGLLGGWCLVGTADLTANLPMIFASLAAAAVISAIFGQIILSRTEGKAVAHAPYRDERKSWIASAAALAGSAGLVQLNGYIDMLLLGSYVSPEEIGVYRAALQIAMLASFGYIALNMLAGQRFARFGETGDMLSLKITATHLSRMALLTALPLPILLLAWGENIFLLLFGAGFAGSALPALIVATGFTFSAAIGMARTLLVMQGNEFLVMRTTIAALAVNIGLCVALIPEYGIIGAAFSNLAATISWNALLWVFARKMTGVDTSALGLLSANELKNPKSDIGE